VVVYVIAVLIVNRLHFILSLLLPVFMLGDCLVLVLGLKVIVGALLIFMVLVHWVLLEGGLLRKFLGLWRLYEVFLTVVFGLRCLLHSTLEWLILLLACSNFIDCNRG
jgi:hypothetical protein